MKEFIEGPAIGVYSKKGLIPEIIRWFTSIKYNHWAIVTRNIQGELCLSEAVASHKESSAIIDDGIITLPSGQSGFGEVYAFLTSSGAFAERARFYFSEDATVVLVDNSTNVTTTGGTNDKLNIYDSGSAVVIENKLGARYTLKLVIYYSDN